MRSRRYLAAAGGLIAATLLVGSPTAWATSTPAQTPEASEPTKAAKKKASWELRSEVNFNGSALPEGCVKYSGKYAAGSSAWAESNATQKDGVLKLKVEKKKTDKQAFTTGGMGCWNWPQTYGKFEIKAKVPTGKGINSYITLSPAKDDSANGLTSIELLAPDTDTAYVSNGYGKGSEQYFTEQTFADKKFHTYTIEWAPNHLLVRLDGQEIFWSQNAYKGSRWISMATTTGDSLSGDPDATSKLPKNFEITSMKIWKYTKEQPEPGTTLSVGTDGTVATPTTEATPGASADAPTPSSTVAAAADSEESSGQKLTGGIWPWLIGGSVMVVSAIAVLSYPGRRKQKQSPRAQQQDPYSRPY
jgi:beta-glucanase (GH16 family)